MFRKFIKGIVPAIATPDIVNKEEINYMCHICENLQIPFDLTEPKRITILKVLEEISKRIK